MIVETRSVSSRTVGVITLLVILASLLAYDLGTGSVFPVLNSTSYSLDVQDGVMTWVPNGI